MIICDTNILIEWYRKNSVITQTLHQMGLSQIAISQITQAELYYGARNQIELRQLKRSISQLHILPIDSVISNTFIQLMEQFTLSHRLSLPDAIIAATALTHELEFYTLNIKDFRFIPQLKLYQP